MLLILKQKLWDWRGIWTIATVVAGLTIALKLLGGLQFWELATFDQYLRWRSIEKRDERIIIVGITETDLRKVGRWPISDKILAQLLLKIKAQNPTAIGLDLYRDLPVEPGYPALLKIFNNTPNLIGIELIDEDNAEFAVAPPPALAEKGQVSFNNIVIDPDGKLRRGIISLPHNNSIATSLGATLAGLYLETHQINVQPTQNPEVLQIGRGQLHRFRSSDGGYANVDDGGYQVLLNYRGPAGSFTTVSMSAVLQGKISPNLMRDRVVLIGATAMSLNDWFYTPYSGNSITTPERMSGVEIQANLTSQLIALALDNRPLIKTPPESVEWLMIILGSGVGTILCWRTRTGGSAKHLLSRWTLLSLVGVGFGGVGGSYLALSLGNWWLPVIAPLVALYGATGVTIAYIARVEHQDRETVMNLFARHVTPQIAEAIWRDREQLLEGGRLPGRKSIATVLFSDLQGFSTVSTTINAETLLSWLNEYMEAMAEQVLQHGGVVDKFIGDAVMAVFGVPIPRTARDEIALDAIAAVSCALAMAETLEHLNQIWKVSDRPQTAMRIGIATGEVIAGSLGSAKRIDYTTLGDSVNIAARLESYDKTLGDGICRILINEETYQYIKDRFPTQFIANVSLKGRGQPTQIYQVLRFRSQKSIIESK
ncbi:MAG: adenylate/guanylate cyclase domain-containing protein [Cyanobacteriota bacterium]|nr:adenylate/guanylate cyclase domain-containing protein [Cyanobacteriota bacterium]